MTGLPLAQAKRIVDAALEKGRALKLAPLTVVVLDDRGCLKAAQSEDGSSLMRTGIATGKAWGVLGMGFGGRELARRAAKMPPSFFDALIGLSGGRMVPVPGGVLIRNADGEIVGAVGVSGDASEKDEDCAVHGIKAAGLAPDTGD